MTTGPASQYIFSYMHILVLNIGRFSRAFRACVLLKKCPSFVASLCHVFSSIDEIKTPFEFSTSWRVVGAERSGRMLEECLKTVSWYKTWLILPPTLFFANVYD